MTTIEIKDASGKKAGTADLAASVFGIEPNVPVMHQVVRAQRASWRQGTHDTKTRGQVRGGGKKPWRQKGTGRARQGSIRAPQWTHGGIVFAPKPRDYSYTLNKKVKRLALKSALSAKAAAGEILVVDGMAVEEIKTAPVKAFLTKIGADGKALLVTERVDEKLVKSSRNIPGVSSTIATILSPYMILTHRVLVIDKAALQKIEEVYA